MKSLWLVFLFVACNPSGHSPIDRSRLEEAWNANNDPVNLRTQYEVQLDKLPLSGELTTKPWTDSYWPSWRGGLADRWFDETSTLTAFEYKLHTKENLEKMTSDELARLSPAEKYDIFNGRYDYPLVRYERERTNPKDPTWYGLCHGWAPAAINFSEPQSVNLRNEDGIEIPFGASDVKALLTYTQQYAEDSRLLGSRCNYKPSDPEHATAPECRDTNAGSFHIVIANQIALLKEAFVADMNRGEEVWNQPIYGFKSAVQEYSDEIYPEAAPGTTRIAMVKTTVHYISELSAAWDPLPITNYPWQAVQQKLQYRLELAADGSIIGGEWDSESRPDFLWTEGRPQFAGYFGAVKNIYEAAIAQ